MGITRRILDSAQSGLSKLTSLVIVDDEPLSNVESAALQAELTARRSAREKSGRKAGDSPIARQALAEPSARAARNKASRERGARVHRERSERETRQRVAADDAFRRMKEQSARNAASGSSSGSGASSSSSGSGASSQARAPRPGSTEAQIADWYRVLDLGAGADMSQIKSAYRQMMRKYHPDMHAGSPQKQKAATELSMRVTSAYNGLVTHLEKK